MRCRLHNDASITLMILSVMLKTRKDGLLASSGRAVCQRFVRRGRWVLDAKYYENCREALSYKLFSTVG